MALDENLLRKKNRSKTKKRVFPKLDQDARTKIKMIIATAGPG